MIGTTISHYSALCLPASEALSWQAGNPARERNPRKRDKILEKIGGGGMFENHPRTICVSGRDFQNPPKRSVGGGVA